MARMELNKRNRLAAGLVSERFPEVSDIIICITYYRKGSNPVIMVRTVNVFPTSYAYFNMECVIKGCINGGFDLTSVIAELIKSHKKSIKGKKVCCGEIDSLSSDHASISYEISIHYNKLSG